MLIKVLLFVCYYLMIGLSIQLFGRFYLDKHGSAETVKQSMDAVDYVIFKDASQRNTIDEADEMMNSKMCLIMNVLGWPINVVVTIYVAIKLTWLSRRK